MTDSLSNGHEKENHHGRGCIMSHSRTYLSRICSMGFTFLYSRSTESLLSFLPPLSPDSAPPLATPLLPPFSMAVNPTRLRTCRCSIQSRNCTKNSLETIPKTPSNIPVTNIQKLGEKSLVETCLLRSEPFRDCTVSNRFPG